MIRTGRGRVQGNVGEGSANYFLLVLPTGGRSFFFHLTDLQDGLDFDAIEERWKLASEINRLPNTDKAGAAQNVRPHAEEPARDEAVAMWAFY